MMKVMASRKKRGRGRPKRTLLSERQMLRLTPVLAAAVEVHRQAMQAKVDEEVEWGAAVRDLLRIALATDELRQEAGSSPNPTIH